MAMIQEVPPRTYISALSATFPGSKSFIHYELIPLCASVLSVVTVILTH